MYVKESQAVELTCHKTINSTHDGKPCKGRKCMAWEPIEWTMTPCPHCGEEIDAAGVDGESWGRCAARWK